MNGRTVGLGRRLGRGAWYCFAALLLLPLAPSAAAQVCSAGTVTLYSEKGSTLSIAEVDANFGEVESMCSALSGLDAAVITGTPGGDGTCAVWNTDGDLVSAACASGSGDITDVGDCSTGACFQAETARHAFLAPAGGGVATFRAITEADVSDLQSYLLNVADDTTPQLGGLLDAQGNGITDMGDVTFKSGASGGTLRTGTSSADLFKLQAYDVDGGTYLDMLELDAGNIPLMFLYHVTEIDMDAGGQVRTGTGAGEAYVLQARDVDGASWTTFATMTANDTPTFDLSSATTVGGATIQTGVDDDVPESGDFGAATDLEADGSLSDDVVAAAEMADADHGDVSWSAGVATVDSGAVGITELADDATCGANEVVARNAGDTAFECQAAGGGGIGGSTGATDNAILRADGTGGSTLQASAWTLDDSGMLAIPAGTSAGFTWGDGDTSLTEAADDILNLTIPGMLWQFGKVGSTASSVGFNITGGAGPSLRATAPSATTPNIHPRSSATGMGLGAASASDLRLITSGVSGLGQTATETTLYVEQVNSPSSQTCTDSGDASAGFLAVTVSGRTFAKLTNADADGCAASLSETGATDGQRLEVVNVSNAGGTLDFADSAGVQETGAGCSLAVWGAATFRYTTDRWVLTGCEPTN